MIFDGPQKLDVKKEGVQIVEFYKCPGILVGKQILIPTDTEAIGHLRSLKEDQKKLRIGVLNIIPGHLYAKPLINLEFTPVDFAKLDAFFEMMTGSERLEKRL